MCFFCFFLLCIFLFLVARSQSGNNKHDWKTHEIANKNTKNDKDSLLDTPLDQLNLPPPNSQKKSNVNNGANGTSSGSNTAMALLNRLGLNGASIMPNIIPTPLTGVTNASQLHQLGYQRLQSLSQQHPNALGISQLQRLQQLPTVRGNNNNNLASNRYRGNNPFYRDNGRYRDNRRMGGRVAGGNRRPYGRGGYSTHDTTNGTVKDSNNRNSANGNHTVGNEEGTRKRKETEEKEKRQLYVFDIPSHLNVITTVEYF